MDRIPLEKKVLSENDRIAARLRESFREHGILCVNLISSPGSGKTSLLERTLERFPKGTRVAVLTGDIQTDNDARRLARFRFSCQADHHRRHVPLGCSPGGARAGGLAFGES